MAHKLSSKQNAGNAEDLYFIAVIPEEPLKARVTAIKKDLEVKYNTRAALKSPPHITLHMPFRWKFKKIDRLTTVLQDLADDFSSFSVELNGFGAFEPRVIFLKVAENDKLHELKHQINEASLKQWKLFERVDTRPFHPHMTVAFRDLNKSRFSLAWAEYKDKEFQAQFEAKKLTLLKHNGKFWEEFMDFALSI